MGFGQTVRVHSDPALQRLFVTRERSTRSTALGYFGREDLEDPPGRGGYSRVASDPDQAPRDLSIFKESRVDVRELMYWEFWNLRGLETLASPFPFGTLLQEGFKE